MIGRALRWLALGVGLVVSLALPSGAAAQGISVTVSRTEASVEDQILMSVTVEGSRRAEPRLPALPDFDVHPRGQSSQVQFVNGKVTSSVIFNFLLLPRRSGSFEVGEATVEIDGETYRSRPIRLKISPAGAKAPESRDLFVTASVSERHPFVGQQVIYTWRLYRRVRIGNAQLTPPSYEGLLVEPLGEAREYEQVVNGQQYLVHELREALFPQREGSLVIPGRQLTAEVASRASRRPDSLMDDFFGRMQTETKVLRTRPVEIEVRPLPDPPADFSGLVGRFAVTAGLSQTELRVRESVTLEVIVSGSGNAQLIPEPVIADLPQFKAYDDQPGGSLDRSGSELRGARTFHRALVAQEVGEFPFEPVTLVYFDPDAEEYRSAASSPMLLRVTPASDEEDLRLTEVVGPTTGKVAVKILADDILPIHARSDGLAAARPFGGSAPLTAAILLLPPLGFLGLAWVQRRRRMLHHDVAMRRRRGALRRATVALREVSSAADGAQFTEAASLASRCLREYLGDKLDLEGAALTATETDRLLRSAGVEQQLAVDVHRQLDDLEAAQYGTAAGELVAADLESTITAVLKRLEKELR